MGNGFIQRKARKTKVPLSLTVDESYKSKYDKLSTDRQIKMAEHLRLVVYPEIDRLWAAEFPEPPDAA